MAPQATFTLTHLDGWMKSKDQIMVLVCAISDDSENDFLMFIGRRLVRGF